MTAAAQPGRRVRALANDDRQRAGVGGLRSSRVLNLSAKAKAKHLASTGRLNHGRWAALIYRFGGRRYSTIGENIASGQDTPAEVEEAWMNSPLHRDNILNGRFTRLGVGHVVRGGKHFWVQHFAG